MMINFNELDLAFRCRRVVFEWERFGIESFQNDASLSNYVYSLFFSLYIRMHKSEDIFRSPVLVQIPIYASLFLSISATRVKLTCICFPLQSLYWFELCWHVLIINWLLLAVLCANSTVVWRLHLLCAEACFSFWNKANPWTPNPNQGLFGFLKMGEEGRKVMKKKNE